MSTRYEYEKLLMSLSSGIGRLCLKALINYGIESGSIDSEIPFKRHTQEYLFRLQPKDQYH